MRYLNNLGGLMIVILCYNYNGFVFNSKPLRHRIITIILHSQLKKQYKPDGYLSYFGLRRGICRFPGTRQGVTVASVYINRLFYKFNSLPYLSKVVIEYGNLVTIFIYSTRILCPVCIWLADDEFLKRVYG